MNRLTVNNRSSRGCGSIQKSSFSNPLQHPKGRRKSKDIALKLQYGSIRCIAEFGSIFGNHIQHWLNIRR